MLDFIVLGIVPGTSFVITLRWALLFGLIFSFSLILYLELTWPSKQDVQAAEVVETQTVSA